MPVSVVTGATSGIGRWIALGLARAGYTVVVVGRDRGRGDEALHWMHGHVPDARIELLVADLSSIAAARHVGMMIDARYPELDLLVNNAGTFCARREETPEGHERVIPTNHLTPFVLPRALIPSLRAAAATNGSARIVNVGSSTSDRARIDPADLEGRRRWGMVRAYSQSKLALMMMTFGWAKRLDGAGVVANVVHPGTVATGLVREPGVIGMAWRMMSPFVLTEEQGAVTPLHACLAPEFATTTAAYVKNCKIVAPNRRALNPSLTEQVWVATETLVGG